MRILIVILGLVVFAGCADQGSTMRQRQDAAMEDPFNYSPFDEKKTNQSNKQEIQKDMKSVFNP